VKNHRLVIKGKSFSLKKVNFVCGLIVFILAPYLLSLTNGKDPSNYWPLSFLFVTAIITFVWGVISVIDTYEREGLPYFTPLPQWPWCFAIWLLSISFFCLDGCRARIQLDFKPHALGNALKFNVALWGVLAFVQYVKLRIERRKKT
jgi:hypothetical protein